MAQLFNMPLPHSNPYTVTQLAYNYVELIIDETLLINSIGEVNALSSMLKRNRDRENKKLTDSYYKNTKISSFIQDISPKR